MPLNWADANWDMFTKPKSLQISRTTDGFTLASPAFKVRYEEEGWTGLSFRPLSNDYFDVRVSRTVKVCHVVTHSMHPSDDRSPEVANSSKRTTDTHLAINRSQSCQTCGRYKRSLGAGTITVARGETPISDNEFVVGETLLWDEDRLSMEIIVGQAIRDSHYKKRFSRCSVYSKARYQGWSPNAA